MQDAVLQASAGWSKDLDIMSARDPLRYRGRSRIFGSFVHIQGRLASDNNDTKGR